PCHRRLPAARFADDAERLAGVEDEIDAVDRLDRADLLLEHQAPRDGEVLLEPFDPQQLAHAASSATRAARFALQMRVRVSPSRWHRKLFSFPCADARSSGSSVRQTSITNSQRGLNGQPGGGFSSDGG